jgi:hemerythrin-like domain-containing protein
MNPVINRLLAEHGNMRRILSLVRGQLDRLEQLDQQVQPDLVLLANALYYMRKFPSVVHHPKEEILFRRLVDAGAPVGPEVAQVSRQHEEIYALEDHLIELTLALQNGDRLVLMRLVELGRHYLAIQGEHSKAEEELLFPSAAEFLRAADWKAVRSKSKQIDDPLFGNSVTERYRYLYDYLLREAADSGIPDTSLSAR